MLLKTGFGYLKDSSDKIVAKFILTAGNHNFSKDYTVHEVDSYEQLQAIEVNKDSSVIINEKEIALNILGLSQQDLDNIKKIGTIESGLTEIQSK